MTRPPFQPASAKLWIGSLDDTELEVCAQYNPKELQVEKQLPWQPHKAKDNRAPGKRGGPKASKQADLEFTGAPTRSMTIELLFDGYETQSSVAGDIKVLEDLASVQEPEADEEELRRPHHCVVAWGETNTGLPTFRCVIESLTTKYMMFLHDGTPVRATCTVKLREAAQMTREARPDRYYYAKDRKPL